MRNLLRTLFRNPERSLLPHDIRLAGPWEYSKANSTDWQRCQLPWTGPDVSDTYVIRRKFHRPTGIDDKSTLSLLIEASGSLSLIHLNSEPISCTNTSPSPTNAQPSTVDLLQSEFEVTAKLNDFNTVELQIRKDTVVRLNQVKLRITDDA